MPLHQPAMSDQPEFDTRDKFLALQDCGLRYNFFSYEQYKNLQWCRYFEMKFANIPVNNMEFDERNRQAVLDLISHGQKFCKVLPAAIKYQNLDQSKLTGFLERLNDALNQRVDPTNAESTANFKQTLINLSTEAQLLSKTLYPSFGAKFVNTILMLLGAVAAVTGMGILSLLAIPTTLSPAMVIGTGVAYLGAGVLAATMGFLGSANVDANPARDFSDELGKEATQDALVKLAGPIRI